MHNKLVKESAEETATKKFKTANKNAEELEFRLFLLGEQECDVEVSEVRQIDFDYLKRQLEGGKSVFMTAISREESIST